MPNQARGVVPNQIILFSCLDTKGGHLLSDAVARKLFDIKEEGKTKIQVRFISEGKQSALRGKAIKGGYTVWKMKTGSPTAVHVETPEKAVSYSWYERQLIAAAERAGIGKLGSHAMRHTHRAWLDAVGTTIAVQQRMMRHTDIRTTMNVYGDIVTDEMSEAHSKVVGLALNGAQGKLSLLELAERGIRTLDTGVSPITV